MIAPHNQEILGKVILREFGNLIVLPDDCSHIVGNDGLIDAVIYILSAVDFIGGNMYFPEDLGLAQKEGWTWFYVR